MRLLRSRKDEPREPFLLGGDLNQAGLYQDPQASFEAETALSDTEPRVRAMLDAGVSSEALHAAVSVAQKAASWIRINFSSKLLRKVESCSPDILFDLEKKVEFTAIMAAELSAFSQSFVQAASDLAEALEAQDEAAASQHAETALKMVLIFITRADRHFSDYAHMFGAETYTQYRHKLNVMDVADRRRIEVFYTKFQNSIAVMNRVFNNEIRLAMQKEQVSINQVFRWLEETSRAISGLYEAARSLVKS